MQQKTNGLEIAVLGMAGRFPGAQDVDTFWTNLQKGLESVSFFSQEELGEIFIPNETLAHPGFVPARGIVEGATQFDAEFFGYYPREAQIMDPQHRVFLECVWQALEDADISVTEQNGPIGVFAGAGSNNYSRHLTATPSLANCVDDTQIFLGNSPHMLATRVCYKLDLHGPGVSILTACSTSLVAVHLACQSLWQGESAMAIAGGVRIAFPQRTGHVYMPNGILSPDGRCRPFDAEAQGTVSSDGAGAVVLKRLEDALSAGDRIRAVIKGSAINNDGGFKVGFTATSIQGQVDVVRAAHAVASVPAESIRYIEAHGTGTALGDPVEIAALTRAFGLGIPTSSCAIGSSKSNIGHTDVAAGIIGLIKTVLVLETGIIPPTIHFQKPNPEIDFPNSPFYVNNTSILFPGGPYPRRAGVSSFGIGGTNAHVVLEEAPPVKTTTESRAWQLLTISAKNSAAVEASSERLCNRLKEHPHDDLADVAYTLHIGRTPFDERRIVVCRNNLEAIQQLQNVGQDVRSRRGRVISSEYSRPAFLFPGGGAQYPLMGMGLYSAEPAFRSTVESCAETAKEYLGHDIRDLLYRSDAACPELASLLTKPAAMMISTFIISYALAQLLKSWGIEPSAMIGHSMGEYVAATLAHVFTLEDALFVVAKRGHLLEQTTPGNMLAVQLSESELLASLPRHLSIAAFNRPDMCVISGASDEVTAFGQHLSACGIWNRRLAIPVAGHSSAVEKIQPDFRESLKRVRLNSPTIPFISCVTGSWITEEQATSGDYWVEHLRQPVRFSQGVEVLLRDNFSVLLEAGPGHTLTALARHSREWRKQVAIATMRAADEPGDDEMFLLSAVGQFWIAGGQINWPRFHSSEQRRRIALPSYPFQRKGYAVRPCHFNQNTVDVESGQQRQVGTPAEESFTSKDELASPSALLTKTERKLQAIWEELFGIVPIGIHDNFFALGGDSFLATRILFRLQGEWQKTVSLRMLSAAPTIARLAVLLDSSGLVEPICTPEILREMTDDAAPSGAISISSPRSIESDRRDLVLLTGATGYLGAHLLKQLLLQSRRRVAGVVRADDDIGAATRIREALLKYNQWQEEFAERIVPLAGHMERPYWGWEEKKFAITASTVQSIYHCAAQVHFTFPYSRLKAVNVTGTREVLRMACTEQLKPVHHVSTLAVFSPPRYTDQIISEDAPLGPPERLPTGYSQSKWVAERLIMNARDSGLAATIYRPGAVLGDTQTAASRPEDFVWRMLKGIIQLGAAPRLTVGIAAAPVDYVAAAIVKLSTMPESEGKTFHIIDPQPLAWSRIFEAAREASFTLDEMSYVDWYTRLLDPKRINDRNALYPIMNLLDYDGPMPTRFTCELTQQFLRGWRGPCSYVGSDLLQRYIHNFIQTAFLSEPSERNVNSVGVALTERER